MASSATPLQTKRRSYYRSNWWIALASVPPALMLLEWASRPLPWNVLLLIVVGLGLVEFVSCRFTPYVELGPTRLRVRENLLSSGREVSVDDVQSWSYNDSLMVFETHLGKPTVVRLSEFAKPVRDELREALGELALPASKRGGRADDLEARGFRRLAVGTLVWALMPIVLLVWLLWS